MYDASPILPWRGVIEGPLATFRGHRIPVPQAPPRDTMDGQRWANCTNHHLACDCREAEHAEERTENRSEYRRIDSMLQARIEGHRTYVFQGHEKYPRRDLECQCQLCDFARAAGLLYGRNSSYVNERTQDLHPF